MDPRISRLKTVPECEAFARNAEERNAPDLANQARKRAVQIRAESYGATMSVELDCIHAIFAYESIMSRRNGRTFRANRTHQMIKRRGIIPAVEHIVAKADASTGYAVLKDGGMQEYAFESVVLRHPDSFSVEAIEASRARLARDSRSAT